MLSQTESPVDGDSAQPRLPASPPILRPYHPRLGPSAQDPLCCWHQRQPKGGGGEGGRQAQPEAEGLEDGAAPAILGVLRSGRPSGAEAGVGRIFWGGAWYVGEPCTHLHRAVPSPGL